MKTILEASTDVSQEDQDQDRFKAKEVKEENVEREVKLLETSRRKLIRSRTRKGTKECRVL